MEHVELYHDNSKKFETTSIGVTVTGHLTTTGEIFSGDDVALVDNKKITFGAGNDLRIYHDSSNGNSHIKESGSGSLVINADDLYLQNAAGTENLAVFTEDGAVELYHDNSKKFQTDTSGAEVFGSRLRLADDVKIALGSGADLQIYHDGSHSRLVDAGTGYIKIQSNQIALLNADDSAQMAQFYAGGAVELYHNNSKKFETTSGGVNVTGALTVNGSAFAGGKVLQQVSATKLTTASNNVGSQNTWEYNDSSLMVTITGASTNNKFLFLGQLTICGEVACHIGLRDNQNSSNVTGMMATGTSNRRASTSGNSAAATDDHSAMTVPIIGVISVPDTNAHSYYYQISHTSGSTREIVINGARNSGDNAERGRYISSLTVMEISG